MGSTTGNGDEYVSATKTVLSMLATGPAMLSSGGESARSSSPCDDANLMAHRARRLRRSCADQLMACDMTMLTIMAAGMVTPTCGYQSGENMGTVPLSAELSGYGSCTGILAFTMSTMSAVFRNCATKSFRMRWCVWLENAMWRSNAVTARMAAFRT
jgi:hypothetical protein